MVRFKDLSTVFRVSSSNILVRHGALPRVANSSSLKLCAHIVDRTYMVDRKRVDLKNLNSFRGTETHS